MSFPYNLSEKEKKAAAAAAAAAVANMDKHMNKNSTPTPTDDDDDAIMASCSDSDDSPNTSSSLPSSSPNTSTSSLPSSSSSSSSLSSSSSSTAASSSPTPPPPGSRVVAAFRESLAAFNGDAVAHSLNFIPRRSQRDLNALKSYARPSTLFHERLYFCHSRKPVVQCLASDDASRERAAATYASLRLKESELPDVLVKTRAPPGCVTSLVIYWPTGIVRTCAPIFMYVIVDNGTTRANSPMYCTGRSQVQKIINLLKIRGHLPFFGDAATHSPSKPFLVTKKVQSITNSELHYLYTPLVCSVVMLDDSNVALATSDIPPSEMWFMREKTDRTKPPSEQPPSEPKPKRRRVGAAQTSEQHAEQEIARLAAAAAAAADAAAADVIAPHYPT